MYFSDIDISYKTLEGNVNVSIYESLVQHFDDSLTILAFSKAAFKDRSYGMNKDFDNRQE